jgi:hypothetical protein
VVALPAGAAMVLLACDVVLALLVKVDDESFLKDDDDGLEELLGWDEEDLEIEEGRDEVDVTLTDVDEGLEDDVDVSEEEDGDKVDLMRDL